MFPLRTPPSIARRAHTALSLARSFLLLEDDHVRDWEVAGDEPGRGDAHRRKDMPGHEKELGVLGVSAGERRLGKHTYADGQRPALEAHPHRRQLRVRPRRGRAGQPAPAPQVCLCPHRQAPTAQPSPAKRTGRPQAART